MPGYLSQPGVLDETIGKSTISNSKNTTPKFTRLQYKGNDVYKGILDRTAPYKDRSTEELIAIGEAYSNPKSSTYNNLDTSIIQGDGDKLSSNSKPTVMQQVADNLGISYSTRNMIENGWNRFVKPVITLYGTVRGGQALVNTGLNKLATIGYRQAAKTNNVPAMSMYSRLGNNTYNNLMRDVNAIRQAYKADAVSDVIDFASNPTMVNATPVIADKTVQYTSRVTRNPIFNIIQPIVDGYFNYFYNK